MPSVTIGDLIILWFIVISQINISNKPERETVSSLIHSGFHSLGVSIGKSMVNSCLQIWLTTVSDIYKRHLSKSSTNPRKINRFVWSLVSITNSSKIGTTG